MTARPGKTGARAPVAEVAIEEEEEAPARAKRSGGKLSAAKPVPSPKRLEPRRRAGKITVTQALGGSYTVLTPGGPSFGLFIAPDGESIATIATDPPGNYVSNIDRRVSRK